MWRVARFHAKAQFYALLDNDHVADIAWEKMIEMMESMTDR
jgi:hypothetical protein